MSTDAAPSPTRDDAGRPARSGTARAVVRFSGSCFGFRVATPFGLHFLRDDDADAALALVLETGARQGVRPGDVLVRTWAPRPGVDWTAQLYRSGSGYRLRLGDAGWYEVDPRERRIALPDGPEALVRREERTWGIPALLCLIARGHVPLHAAALEVDGAALLIAGPSGAGKTTLAAAFAARGHRLLAEDLSCVRLDGGAAVVPGPAMLRLRRDVAEAVRPPGEVVARDPERVHLALPRDERGTCAPVPLRGVVLLHGAADDVALEPVAPARALPDLWALSYKGPDAADRARCFRAVAAVAEAAPIWSLRRPMRLGALEATVARLVAAR